MRTCLNRWMAALLVLALTLGLAGCKENEPKTVELAFHPAPNYTQEALTLPLESGLVEGACAGKNAFWFLVTPGENEPPVLCRVPLDGGAAELLPEYQPPELENDKDYFGIWGPVWGGDGKLWVWEQLIDWTGDKKITTYQMCQLDPNTGAELGCVDVTVAMELLDLMRFSGMAVDKDGNIFLSDNRRLTVTDKQGLLLFALDDYAGGNTALFPDGSAAVLSSNAVRTVDLEKQDWGEVKYPVGSTNQIFSGEGDCLFFYIQNNILYTMAEGDELPQRLLSWSDTHINTGDTILAFALLDEDKAAVLTQEMVKEWEPYAGQLSAVILSPTDELPDDGKIKLVYGMIGDDYSVRYRLDQFNRNSDVYYIEARDYAEGLYMVSQSARENAVTRLFAEIAAGKGPDILDNSLPLNTLAKQGVLEDLWPWIENDPELGRDGVMEHVLECLETDGKQYQICGGFAINTAVTSKTVAGDRTGWTLEEMLDAFGGNMPEFYFGYTSSANVSATFARFDRNAMVERLVGRNLDRYIDWNTGECFFDSEDFKAILRICGEATEAENSPNEFNEEYRETYQVLPWEGEPVLYTRTLSEPMDLLVDDVLFGGRESLWDYEQKLWDAGILYYWTIEANGRQLARSYADIPAFGYIGDFEFQKKYIGHYAKGGTLQFAADAVCGAMDGNVYAAYVGLPAQNGTGSSFSVYNKGAISAACSAKEGAWEFLRYLLLPDGNVSYSQRSGTSSIMGTDTFPMNRAEFERQVMPEPVWCINPETGELYLDSNGEPVKVSIDCMAFCDPAAIVVYQLSPSQAQKDRFWNLYNSIEHISETNWDLMDIIIEQAQSYFAGDKSLDETAALIQNRASLYVNERK